MTTQVLQSTPLNEQETEDSSRDIGQCSKGFVGLEILLKILGNFRAQYEAYENAARSGERGALLRFAWLYSQLSNEERTQVPIPVLDDLPGDFFHDPDLPRRRYEKELWVAAWSNKPLSSRR